MTGQALSAAASWRRRRSRGHPGRDAAGGRRAGDVALRPVLVVGLDQLLVLLLDVLGVLARRAEQQLLEVAEQVLPGLRGHLTVGDRGLQLADERGSRGGGRRQGAGVLAGSRPDCAACAGARSAASCAARWAACAPCGCPPGAWLRGRRILNALLARTVPSGPT